MRNRSDFDGLHNFFVSFFGHHNPENDPATGGSGGSGSGSDKGNGIGAIGNHRDDENYSSQHEVGNSVKSPFPANPSSSVHPVTSFMKITRKNNSSKVDIEPSFRGAGKSSDNLIVLRGN